jgi:hypothetical protein
MILIGDFIGTMIIVTILVVVVNGLGYWIKYTLKENGYEVSWFWGHFRDLINIFHLARCTEEVSAKKKYYFMAYGIVILILTVPLAVLLTLR